MSDMNVLVLEIDFKTRACLNLQRALSYRLIASKFMVLLQRTDFCKQYCSQNNEVCFRPDYMQFNGSDPLHIYFNLLSEENTERKCTIQPN